MAGTTDSSIREVGSPERLFLEELETVERAIRHACRRGSLRMEDADDFASYVKLKLIENSYAIIRKYERRSTFSSFISVVVQRMLIDYRIGQWGKWHGSAEAKRMGEPAITIEVMLYRDGRTIDEVFPALRRRWPNLTMPEIDAIVRRLPTRTRRLRAVELDAMSETAASLVADDGDGAFESERAAVARRITSIVRETMADLDEHDRLIFRMHFEGGMSVADISRTLKMEQKPLYRRVQRALIALRKRLESAGINASDAEDILSSRSTDLDFGFDGGAFIPYAASKDEGDT